MHVNLFYPTKNGKELNFFRDKLIYRKIKQKKVILRYYAYLSIYLSLKWRSNGNHLIFVYNSRFLRVYFSTYFCKKRIKVVFTHCIKLTGLFICQ